MPKARTKVTHVLPRQAAGPEKPGADRLLEGLVVVELGDRVAVGACGGLLAGLGATVIFVERVDHGDADKWAQRAAMAAGKQSVVIDEKKARDKALLASLLSAADVVIVSTDRTPSNAAIWDGARPRQQIICDITAFGHSGPLAGVPHSEALVQALAGVAETTGHRDSPPAITGAPFVEMETAVYSVAAILGALRYRRRSGIGQRIDMSIFETGVNAVLTFYPLQMVGRPATRNGNRHPTCAPWNAYRASDGWVLICGPTNDQWRRLCAAMQTPDLVEEERFATTSARLENVDELDEIVGAWVRSQTMAQCIASVSAHGIPVSSIVRLDELASEPNLLHRAMVQRAEDPVAGGDVFVSGTPFRVAGELKQKRLAVPTPDQQRAAIRELVRTTVRDDSRVSGDAELPRQALHGIRVIEIGMNTVAPLATKQLGALGADVIKLEPPTGDTNRTNPPLRADGQAYFYAMSNTDKRGLVLDLKQPGDRDTLWKLLATADMVIENLRPGALAKLGFSGEDVLRRLPHMIYCSVNGFGYHTVYPGRPALDTVIQAMSGAMAVTSIDGVPTKAGISISDQLGGQFGLAGMLAALEYRERTGKGVHLDLAMQDCSAWSTQMAWNGGWTSNARVIRASDGYVVVESRGAAACEAAIQNSTALTRHALVQELNSVTPNSAAPVLTVAEVMAHPQTIAKGLFKDVPTADGSIWLVPESPLRLLSTPAKARSTMSRLGFLDAGLAAELDLDGAAQLQRRAGISVGG